MASAYEECAQILVQDTFNRLSTESRSASSLSREDKASAFFQDESQAYEQYKQDHEEAHRNHTTIDTEFHYGIIGGELAVALSAEDKLSESQFHQQFTKAKQQRSESHESKQASAQDFTNRTLVSTRDVATVAAWKDCVSRTRETNIYAFATRDDEGSVQVNVLWVPGVFASTAPSVPVSFVSHRGVSVRAARTELIAVGSGKSFAVDCERTCDKGFKITVNAELKRNGRLVNSFTSTVVVPPVAAPVVPCTEATGYPLGRWKVTASNIPAMTFVVFTERDGGTWIPSRGSGRFTLSQAPMPGAHVVLTYRAEDVPGYTSVNQLVVSQDGCTMQGTYSDGNVSGEVRYDWEGRR